MNKIEETIKDIEKAIENGHHDLKAVLEKFMNDQKTKPYMITVSQTNKGIEFKRV